MGGAPRVTRRSMLCRAAAAAAAIAALETFPAVARGAQPSDVVLSPHRSATYEALVTVVASDPGLATPPSGLQGVVDDFARRYSCATAAERSDLDTILDAVAGVQAGGTPFDQRSTSQQISVLKSNLRPGEGRTDQSRLPDFTAAALTIAANPFCPEGTQVPPLQLLIEHA